MPNDEQGFNWEKIKNDPGIWMRLATPMDKNNTLGRVFTGDENPFQKDSDGAVEKLKNLANAGKLYLREYGRASHFRKVEMDGEEPKLEGRYVQTLNGNTDPVAGLLMRASRAYFKWLGFESISNWFDKKLKQRDERIEYDRKYREEYKSLSKQEKKELKKREKQEKLEAKAKKKLEKLEKAVEKARKELDKIQGKDTSNTKGEMDSPLANPPEVDANKNTMQPTLTGDQLVQQQQQLQQNKKENLTQQQTTEQQILGTKKTGNQPVANQQNLQFSVNGVEYTQNDLKAMPEEIKRAVELLTSFIAQQKAMENTAQQKKNANLSVEQTAQYEVLSANQPGVPDLIIESSGFETVPQQEEGKTAVEGEVNKGNIPSPVEQPAELEPEKVSMQKPSEKQEANSLQQRLAAEAQEMDRVKDWKGLLANSLFSHEEAKSYLGNYEMVKDYGNLGAEYVLGTVAGMLSSKADPETKQQVIDALISGKPLGNEHQEILKAGIASMTHAEKESTFGNKKEQAEMLADTIRTLSQQASRESGLSPRNVMIGRMIGNIAAMATENGLELPLDEDDMILARGAATMGDLAIRYHNAKQHLGQENMDLSGRTGRNAVRDLLAGKAIETMISDNHKEGQEITNTQMLMGQGLWDMENLLVMTRDSKTCQQIKPEQVKSLLEEPNGFKAATVANSITTDLLHEAMEIQKSVDDMMEKQLQNEEQLEQPEMNQIKAPG